MTDMKKWVETSDEMPPMDELVLVKLSDTSTPGRQDITMPPMLYASLIKRGVYGGDDTSWKIPATSSFNLELGVLIRDAMDDYWLIRLEQVSYWQKEIEGTEILNRMDLLDI